MVFYFGNMWPEDKSRGITKKAFAQMEAMKKLGNEVSFFTGYKNDGVYVFDSNGDIVSKLLFKTSHQRWNRIFRSYYLKELAFQFLKEYKDCADIFYSRYLFFDPYSKKLFKQAKKNGMFVILELHSYPCYFKKRYTKYPLYLMDYLFRKSTIRYIDVIAAMTDAINIWGKKTICFENGIDLENTSGQKRVRENNIIRIIAVSYEWEVHGYDRLLKGMKDYYQSCDRKYLVQAVFVGTVMDSTKKLISEYGLEKNVELTGIKSGMDLDNLYDKCDIGMGCMALHRRSNNAVSDLKTREYLAKGIPYIYAGNQLGEDLSFKYACKMPEGEGGIDINRIIDFYESFKNDDNIAQIMRVWAKKYTWEQQMKPVLECARKV